MAHRDGGVAVLLANDDEYESFLCGDLPPLRSVEEHLVGLAVAGPYKHDGRPVPPKPVGGLGLVDEVLPDEALDHHRPHLNAEPRVVGTLVELIPIREEILVAGVESEEVDDAPGGGWVEFAGRPLADCDQRDRPGMGRHPSARAAALSEYPAERPVRGGLVDGVVGALPVRHTRVDGPPVGVDVPGG